MIITVDGREDERRVVQLESHGIRAAYDPHIHFDFADYAWTSSLHDCVVGLQLKSVAETINRFKQRELGWILRGLHQEYDVPIFLMFGGLKRSSDGFCQLDDFNSWQKEKPIKIPYDGLMNYIFHSLPKDLPGMLVEWAPNEKTAISRIASLVKYWDTETTGATWMPRKQRVLFSMNPEEEAAMGFLMGFPEIGEEMAKRILNSGVSIGDMIVDVRNGAALLKDIPGLGPERIKAIQKMLEYKKDNK